MKKRKDGRYCKKISIDGEPKFFYSTAKTERAAERDINQQVINYQAESYVEQHNFEKLVEQVLEVKEKAVSYSTYKGYYYAAQHLKPFYDMDIEDITPKMLQNLLDSMKRKHYASATISKTKIIFGIVLNYAITEKHSTATNFMSLIRISKTAPKRNTKAPDDEVIDTIVSNAMSVDFGMWAMIELCTGLRRGELAALQRKNIDFKNKLIYVEKSIEFIGNRPRIKDMPKTEESIGSVPIIDILYEPLRQICNNMQSNDFILSGTAPYTLTMLRRRWKNYCKKVGYNFNQHQLRHAYAKLLYRSGIDPKTMQRLLRHAKFETTMNIYTEFDDEVTDISVGKINAYICQKF